jgi:small subunit ribosomal protein S8
MPKNKSNNHNYHLANFLGSLLVAQQKKKVICIYWPCSKFVLEVTKVLRAEGFISGFSVTEERNAFRITVYLKYYTSSLAPLISKLRIYASPSYAFSCSYSQLVKIAFGKAEIFFLSTSRGIKTSEYCLSHKLGGNLLFKIR